MNAQIRQIIRKLQALGNRDIALHSQHFFKTGKGQYGEGDRFLGIRVPMIRKCVREYRTISLEDILELLKSPFHEARLLALLILVAKFSAANRSSSSDQEAVYRSYLGHTKYINNWDLVDCSAEHIVGAHLFPETGSPFTGWRAPKASGSEESVLYPRSTSSKDRTFPKPWLLLNCCCTTKRI